MSDSIPDVILRLARRHLPVDAAAPEDRLPLPEHELPDLPAAQFGPVRPAPIDDVAESSDARDGDRVPAPTERSAQEPAASSHAPAAVFVDHQNPAPAANAAALPADIPGSESPASHDVLSAVAGFSVHSAGATPTPTSRSRADGSTLFPTHGESFVGAEPAFVQNDIAQPGFEHSGHFAPAFPSRNNRQSAVNDQSDDSFEPLDRSKSAAGGSHNQSPVDAVGESSRQLEQTARDLETSLTRLFATQIETLQQLRNRIAEHERRWVEQQSARRATL